MSSHTTFFRLSSLLVVVVPFPSPTDLFDHREKSMSITEITSIVGCQSPCNVNVNGTYSTSTQFDLEIKCIEFMITKIGKSTMEKFKLR
jgi:hypothetical protein